MRMRTTHLRSALTYSSLPSPPVLPLDAFAYSRTFAHSSPGVFGRSTQYTARAPASTNASAISTLTSDIAGLSATDLGNGSAIAAGAGNANFKAVFGANAAIDASGKVTGISATSPAGVLVGTGTNASVTVNATTPFYRSSNFIRSNAC